MLELGTAHGVGAAYMAAAGAHVTTVDYAGAAYDPSPEEVLARAGVADRVTIVREFSSYTWWLKERVAERSDAHGNVEPCFDFVYLDGAKNWTIDGLAVVLVEKLLRPGGWLLMDDLEWTYAQDPGREATDGIVHRDAVRARAHRAAPARGLRPDRRPAPVVHGAAPAGRVVGLGAQGARRAAPLHASRRRARWARSRPARRASSLDARAAVWHHRSRDRPARLTSIPPRAPRRPLNRRPRAIPFKGVPHASLSRTHRRPVHPSSTTRMRGADALVGALERAGVETVFGIPGGACLPIYDALHDSPIRHVLMRHEAAAGHAAEGYARASGRVGVAIGTCGPGATNLVTAIADAQMDSTPTLFITGQVKTTLRGTNAFQEADVIGITAPIVKHSFAIERADDIAQAVVDALHIATQRPARAGPDRPAGGHRAGARARRDARPVPAGLPPAAPAERPPGALGGGGARGRAAAGALRGRRRRRRPTRLAELRALGGADRRAVTTTLMALGAFPASDPRGSGCSACTARASPTGRWTRPT